MARDEVTAAYAARAAGLVDVLGAAVSAGDPDRAVIEPWAATVGGRILDVGSGTGRWTGHLAALGHRVEGLEPVERFVDGARRAFPGVPFRLGTIADLAGSGETWSGILAWYSLIHLGPDDLPAALATLRGVLADAGSLLMSFFSGPRLEAFAHPVATAYRWPLPDLTRALTDAGLEMVAHHGTPPAPHAVVLARRRE